MCAAFMLIGIVIFFMEIRLSDPSADKIAGPFGIGMIVVGMFGILFCKTMAWWHHG